MDLNQRSIALTGATGFLGRYLVRALQARGAQVVGLVRNPDKVPALKEAGVELRQADLSDRKALAAGMEGCDALISNAALFSIPNRDWRSHEETNVLGTTNVLKAAKHVGISRVVHVSSVAVYSKGRGVPTQEDHPLLEQKDRGFLRGAYQLSKALSEKRAWQLAKERGLGLTTVRPSAIYGAFDPNFTRYLKKLFAFPLAPVPAFLHFPLVYAGDVAEGILACLEKEISIGKAYNLAGADRPFWSFAEAWRDAGGEMARFHLPLPVPVKRQFDSSLAEWELGWENRSYRDGLLETFSLEYADGV